MAVTQTDCLRPVSKRLLDSAPERLLLRTCCTFKLSLQQQQPAPGPDAACLRSGCRASGLLHTCPNKLPPGWQAAPPQCQRPRWIARSEPTFHLCTPAVCQAAGMPTARPLQSAWGLIPPLVNRELQLLEIRGRPHPWFPARGLPTLAISGYCRQNQIHSHTKHCPGTETITRTHHIL